MIFAVMRGVGCVWLRYFAVFKKNLLYYAITTFLEPIMYLLSFGVGVGALVGEVQTSGVTLSYRSFVFSGIIAQTVLFLGFFEAAYGGYIRMNFQRVFQAVASTPITLSEVIWGELVWDASKASLAAMVVALIGVITGDFPAVALGPLLPVCFLSSLTFAGLGLIAAAFARNIDQLSYPQFLIVFPMFLFCGVFYPLDTLPTVLQVIAWIFPLTAICSIIRTLTLGLEFNPASVVITLFWLVALVAFARKAMLKRLVK